QSDHPRCAGLRFGISGLADNDHRDAVAQSRERSLKIQRKLAWAHPDISVQQRRASRLGESRRRRAGLQWMIDEELAILCDEQYSKGCFAPLRPYLVLHLLREMDPLSKADFVIVRKLLSECR